MSTVPRSVLAMVYFRYCRGYEVIMTDGTGKKVVLSSLEGSSEVDK